MSNYLFKAKNGEMEFTSEFSKALFKQNLKDNEGKQYSIEKVKDPVSDNLRAFYFGAVVPVIRTTCEQWESLTSDQIHDIIKKMLFYFETYNPLTQRIERFGRSVMKKDDWNNNTKAGEFLRVVEEYIIGAGREFPNSEEYNAWKNSSPLKGEIYKK